MSEVPVELCHAPGKGGRAAEVVGVVPYLAVRRVGHNHVEWSELWHACPAISYEDTQEFPDTHPTARLMAAVSCSLVSSPFR
jgi:hypothetical protein